MDSESDRKTDEETDLLPEYDFRGGVRGKYADAYRQGYDVRVNRASQGFAAEPSCDPTADDVDLVPEAHRAELDRRLADLEENPEAGSPWEEVRARLERMR